MAQIPTYQQLYTECLSDLEGEFGISIPFFTKNFLRIRASVQAARLKKYYLGIGKLQKNVFIDTADPEAQGGTLERFGRVKLNRNPFPAISGEYLVQFTGTDGQVVPAFLPIKADDTSSAPQYIFQLDSPYTLAGVQQATIRALTSGIESRLLVGDTLTITSPIALVNSTVTVVSEVVIPQSSEDIEEYREKGMEAYRIEAQGGSGADYRLWSSDAQGVEQVYPYAQVGQDDAVDLYIEATTIDSTDGKGTPTPTIIAAVTAAIEAPTVDRPSRKPLGTIVNYMPITPLDIDITINDFQGLTPTVQTLIETAIASLVNNIRPFVDSIDVLSNRNDIIDTNRIVAAIYSVSPGSVFGAIDLVVDGNPLLTYMFEDGDIPYMNSITFL